MIQRVNGSLAVSRALGDFEYKNVDGKGPTEQLVSPEPEFYMKKREADNDEFLVLGKFQMFDMGPLDNERFYGTRFVPSFDIRKTTAKVGLFSSLNDWVSQPRVTILFFSSIFQNCP